MTPRRTGGLANDDDDDDDDDDEAAIIAEAAIGLQLFRVVVMATPVNNEWCADAKDAKRDRPGVLIQLKEDFPF
jgi:hypothetical protein